MKNILLICITCSLFVLTGCPDSTDLKGTMSNKYQTHSPKGVSVRSKNKITPQHLTKIDAGLDKAFRIAEAAPHNYAKFTRHGSYTIWLWPRSPKCEQAAVYRFYATAGGSAAVYDQGPYDKDPRPDKVGLCFAGIQRAPGIGSDIAPGMLLVDDLGVLETVTWYEAEHNIVQQEDLAKWFDTIGANHFHPILGEERPASLPTGSFAGITFESPESVDVDGFKVEKGDLLHVLITK
ncbi:MAG: hypothetical protein ABL984_08735 [Pyrinomonadaceae bacterium]